MEFETFGGINNYMKITQICSKYSKQSCKYISRENTNKLIGELQKSDNLCYEQIIIIKKGGSSNSGGGGLSNSSSNGTWIHFFLAADFCCWVNAEVSIEFMKKVNELLMMNMRCNSIMGKEVSIRMAALEEKKEDDDDATKRMATLEEEEDASNNNSNINNNMNTTTNSLVRWTGKKNQNGYPNLKWGWSMQTEDDLAIKANDFAKSYCKRILVIPTLGEFQTTSAHRLAAKMKGYIKGVSDVIIFSPLPGEYVSFVEFKKPYEGKQSESQIEFQKIVESLGFRYRLIDCYDDWVIYLNSLENAAMRLESFKRQQNIQLTRHEIIKYGNQICAWKHVNNSAEISIEKCSGLNLYSGDLGGVLIEHQKQYNISSGRKRCRNSISSSNNSNNNLIDDADTVIIKDAISDKIINYNSDNNLDKKILENDEKKRRRVIISD